MIETWTTPHSSNIAGGTYDPDARQATIEFRSGGIYSIDSIDRATLDEMIASPSPTGYYNRHIRNTYTVRKT